jgi:3',5'-cyclic AMP phosphodiesterase CpdA
MIVIAHLSDTHITLDGQHAEGVTRSIQRTRTVMRYLEELPFDLDAVLVTGDVADHGTPAEYEQARSVLASRHPVLICPGNHDERAAFRRHLLRQRTIESSGAAPVNQVLRIAGCVIVACDSSVPGKDEGRLDGETLAWLTDVLDRTPANVPVLVAFHHPPARLHIPFVDGIRQFGTGRLAALAKQHPNIVGYLCGHAHTAAATTFADRPLRVAPAVVSTMRLPWEQPVGDQGHVYLDRSPALAFHLLDDEGRLTTHYRCVVD